MDNHASIGSGNSYELGLPHMSFQRAYKKVGLQVRNAWSVIVCTIWCMAWRFIQCCRASRPTTSNYILCGVCSHSQWFISCKMLTISNWYVQVESICNDIPPVFEDVCHTNLWNSDVCNNVTYRSSVFVSGLRWRHLITDGNVDYRGAVMTWYTHDVCISADCDWCLHTVINNYYHP